MSGQETPPGGWLRPAVISASVVCYGASLALPALTGEWARVHGWECMLLGWLLLLDLNPIWLANLVWLAAVILLERGRLAVAARVGLGASALSLLTLLYCWRGWLIIPAFDSESDTVTALGPGFYAWSAAIWIPTLAAAFLRRQEQLEAEGGPGRF